MKKLQYILFASLLGFNCLTACSPEQDELFADSAAERSSKDIARVHQILKEAPNGWLAEYFCDLNYGGFNVLMKFTEDSVTIASEKVATSHIAGLDAEGKCITATSHFKLEQSMGTVLSVDEYNEVFHYFSTPNNPDQFGTKDEGLLGDFEFRIISACKDSIVMKGKKHGDRILMTPVAESKTWEDVLNDAATTAQFMDSRNYMLSGTAFNDETQAVAIQSNHTLMFQYKDSLGDAQTVVAPFIFTPSGMKFYRSINVNGIWLDGIEKGDNQDRYYAQGNHDLWINSYLPTLYEHLTGSYWFIAYSELGEYAQPKWDKLREGLKKAKKGNQEPVLNYAMFGYYSGRLALTLMIDGEIAYQGCTSEPLDDQTGVTLKWSSGAHNNLGDRYYKNYGLRDAQEPFYGTRGRSFSIETDDQRHPTYLILRDKNEPKNVIKLLDREVANPLDN